MYSIQDAIKKGGIADKERKTEVQDRDKKLRTLLGPFVAQKIVSREEKERQLHALRPKGAGQEQPTEDELESTTFKEYDPNKFDVKTNSENFIVQQIAKSLTEKNRKFLLSVEHNRTNQALKDELDSKFSGRIKNSSLDVLIGRINRAGSGFNQKFSGRFQISNLGFRMRPILQQMYTESQLRSMVENVNFINSIIEKHYDLLLVENAGSNDETQMEREVRLTKQINERLEELAVKISGCISRAVVQASGTASAKANNQKLIAFRNENGITDVLINDVSDDDGDNTREGNNDYDETDYDRLQAERALAHIPISESDRRNEVLEKQIEWYSTYAHRAKKISIASAFEKLKGSTHKIDIDNINRLDKDEVNTVLLAWRPFGATSVRKYERDIKHHHTHLRYVWSIILSKKNPPRDPPPPSGDDEDEKTNPYSADGPPSSDPKGDSPPTQELPLLKKGQGLTPTQERHAMSPSFFTSGKGMKKRVIPLLSKMCSSGVPINRQPVHSGFYKPPPKVGKGIKPLTGAKPSKKVISGALGAGSDNPFYAKLLASKRK